MKYSICSLIAASTLAMGAGFGCSNKPESPEPQKPATHDERAANATQPKETVENEILTDDYAEAAEKEITETNYQAELDKIAAELEAE